MILPAILKTLGTLTGNIRRGVSLPYSYRWVDWAAQTFKLQAREVRRKGSVLKRYF